MPYINIKDFKAGLDTRRSILSSVQGSLLTLNNFHINEGGQIEKRKAFVKTTMPASTFGLQQTATTIYKFGSAAAPSMPSGFSYQRLQHPAVLAGTTYDGALHAMKSVVASTLFSTAAFVIVQFADDGVYCYYNGNLVSDYVSGIVLAYMNTNGKIATNIVSLLSQTTGYALSTQVGSSAVLDIIGPVGTTYTTNITKTTVAGTLVSAIKNNGLQPVNGVQAVGKFSIIAGSRSAGVNFISSVKLHANAITLTTSSIDFVSTIFDTAIAVANNISANAGVTGYYAIADSNSVLLYSLALGSTPNDYDVVVVAAGNVCIGNCQFTLSGDSTVGIAGITANGVTIAGSASALTASHSITSNVATIVTQAAHSFVVGSKITITGCTVTTYNKTNVTILTVPSSTSFTFALTNANLGSVADVTGTVSATNTIIAGASTINSLATQTAAAINANSANGYLACALGAIVYVSKVTTSSSDSAVSVIVTPNVGLTVSTVTPTGTTIALSTASLVAYQFNNGVTVTTSVAVVLGGVTNPPFQFNWTLVSGSTLIVCDSPTSASTTFTYNKKLTNQNPAYPRYSTVQYIHSTADAVYKCNITDVQGNSLSTPTITVSFIGIS